MEKSLRLSHSVTAYSYKLLMWVERAQLILWLRHEQEKREVWGSMQIRIDSSLNKRPKTTSGVRGVLFLRVNWPRREGDHHVHPICLPCSSITYLTLYVSLILVWTIGLPVLYLHFTWIVQRHLVDCHGSFWWPVTVTHIGHVSSKTKSSMESTATSCSQ